MKIKNLILPVLISLVIFISALTPSAITPVFNSGGTELLILMYHGVLKDPKRTGKYVITPQKFEEDLVYLKKNGYGFVTAKQVVKYVFSGAPLPEKPVLLTFDDGMYNNLEYVLPLLEKHDAYAVFSVVGSYTDEYSEKDIVNPAYSYLRWCDINSLAASGRVEFANHSYDFHSSAGTRIGAAKKKSESDLEYIENFHSDTQKLQSAFQTNCNFQPFIYTYPFGSISRESRRALSKMEFLMSLSCTEGKNYIQRNENCLYLLKRFNRDGRLSTESFFKKIL